MRKAYAIVSTDNRVLVLSETPIEVESHETILLSINDDIDMMDFRGYIVKDNCLVKDDFVDLQDTKDEKKTELENACVVDTETNFTFILNGEKYHMFMGREVQQDFSNTYQLFVDNMITTTYLTASYLHENRLIRLPIDKVTMNFLMKEFFNHRTNNTNRLYDLFQKVETAGKIEEVKSITW